MKKDRRLSKIETLTLAKNYIIALTKIICEMRGELDPFEDQPLQQQQEAAATAATATAATATAATAVAAGQTRSSAAKAKAAAAEIDRRLQLALQQSDESMDFS